MRPKILKPTFGSVGEVFAQLAISIPEQKPKKKANPEVRLCLLQTSPELSIGLIQFWPPAGTSTVPSGSTLTVISGFRGFACATCFSSVEVLKAYVDSHDPLETATKKYRLP